MVINDGYCECPILWWLPDSLFFPSDWVKSQTVSWSGLLWLPTQHPILFSVSSLLTVNCCTMSATLISTAPGSCHIELIILVGTEKWTLLTWAPHQIPIQKPTTKNQLNEWPLYKMSSLPRIHSLNLHIYCVFERRLPHIMTCPWLRQGLSCLHCAVCSG